MTARLLLLAMLGLVMAGCLGSSASPPRIEGAAAPTELAVIAAKQAADRTGTCPLTVANGRTPPGRDAAGMNHGNGKLWTVLWPHSVVIVTPDYVEEDGSIGMKFPWWRGVNGHLRIEGRRLDGEAPPLTTDFSHYGDHGFQPSGIYFPTEGCWEVTGRVGDAELTFVTLVVEASTYGLVGEVSG